MHGTDNDQERSMRIDSVSNILESSVDGQGLDLSYKKRSEKYHSSSANDGWWSITEYST